MNEEMTEKGERRFSFKSIEEAPHLAVLMEKPDDPLMPGFLFEDPGIVAYYQSRLWEIFPAYQIVITDEKDKGKPIGILNTMPLTWREPLENLPGEGFDWALGCPEMGGNWHCLMYGVIMPEYRGHGLSEKMLRFAKRMGQARGHQGTIAPVRPTRKQDFPHMPMEVYLDKRHEDGRVYDPWLRLHLSLGARVIKVCHRSMTVRLPLDEWHKYGAVPSEENQGELIVPGGLVPVKKIPDEDIGLYEEPNVWMLHEY
uniref:Acetyltransferase (GNAT) family n=1 Tax=Candidatus Kentrum sp. LFY TaxID=2126342 RepID=A0A450UGG7_9GAMM|nr:MAG: Acetyltransferase (GNAT) family [Candidatus Kentron sp. LFY]